MKENHDELPSQMVPKVRQASAPHFLIFQDASFITGQTIAVDGGRSVGIPFAIVN